MLCGTGSFKYVDDDLTAAPRSSASLCRKKSKRSNNPYSSRGLDKFSMVVSELEARREKIVARVAAKGGTPLIKFMYTSTQDWIPIIIRLHEADPPPAKKKYSTTLSFSKVKKPPHPQPIPLPLPAPETVLTQEKEQAHAHHDQKEAERKKAISSSWMDPERWRRWRPSYYLLVVMFVVLFGLVFGRVFAIFCTSIWWYMVPNMKGQCDGLINGGDGGRRRASMKKKELGRRASDKYFARKMSGLPEVASPRSTVHGRKASPIGR